MYIDKSFDTIFNMGYGSGKSPMEKRVNKEKRLIEILLEKHLSPLTLKDPSVCLFNYNLIIFYCMVHPLSGENPLVENRGIQGPQGGIKYVILR